MSLRSWFRMACLVAVTANAWGGGDASQPKPPDKPVEKTTGSETEKPSENKTSDNPKDSAPNLADAQFLDGVVAVVNDKLVTVQDVYAESRFLERQGQLGYAPSEWEREEIRDEYKKKAHAIRVSIANRLVDELLISAEFTRRGYKLPESIIDQRIHRAAERSANGDLEVMRDELKRFGLTMAGFRERNRRRLHSDILLNQEVFGTIKVSPQEIEDYRKAHEDDFKPKPLYKLGMHYCMSEDAEAAAAVQKLLAKLLAEGKDLDAINAALAKGPEVVRTKATAVKYQQEDWITIDGLEPRFRPPVNGLKKGGKSGVVRNKRLVFQFTVLDVKEPKALDPQETYLKIHRKLLYFKRKKAQRAFVGTLYNRSYVRKFYQE